MCVHVRAQRLRGRDWPCSLSAWLNRRGQAWLSEDRPECSSDTLLAPTQTSDRHGLQKHHRTNQKKQTNKRMLRFKETIEKFVLWQEERNIVFVYFFTWAFHCFWGSDLKHYRANISLMEKKQKKNEKKLYSVNYVQFLYSLTNVFLLPSR